MIHVLSVHFKCIAWVDFFHTNCWNLFNTCETVFYQETSNYKENSKELFPCLLSHKLHTVTRYDMYSNWVLIADLCTQKIWSFESCKINHKFAVIIKWELNYDSW